MLKTQRSSRLNKDALALSKPSKNQRPDQHSDQYSNKSSSQQLDSNSFNDKWLNSKQLNSKQLNSKEASRININNQTKHKTGDIDTNPIEIGALLTKRYRGVNLYGAVMFLLAVAIIWTAVLAAEQVQQYHQDYMSLQTLKSEHRKLKIENQRLIIEQQTFSATPQIALRAVTELGMYSPRIEDKLILQPMAKPSAIDSAINEVVTDVYQPAGAQGVGETGE